jgi:hypothetical protein
MRAFNLVFAIVLAHSGAAPAGQLMRTKLSIEEGSLPPLKTPFRCATDLDGQPYSTRSIEDCRKAISSLPYVNHVNVRIKSANAEEASVEFSISAKPLRITELRFDVGENELPRLREWLARNPNNLRLGSPYSSDAESATYQGIKQYYLARGVLVGIVPTLHFDYREGAARIFFQIVQGPAVPVQPAYFPYGDACEDEVSYMDWSAIDQFVPVNLVESQIRLRALGTCFSPGLVERDQMTLEQLGVFEEAGLTYSGSKGSRNVVLKLRGKHLEVAEVSVNAFGPFGQCTADLKGRLALKANMTYDSDLSQHSIRDLTQACSGSDRWVEIVERDDLTPDRRLLVSFTVLAFPLQTIFVDGQIAQ